MMRLLLRIQLTLLAACAAGSIGCSSASTPKSEDPGAAHLRKIGQAYDLFTEMKKRPPRDDDELKSMFPELGEKGDPNQILRSSRDGELIVIHYGPKFDSDARGIILAHEKTGKDGKRYVLTQARMVLLQSDDEFAGATFPPGAKK